MENFASCRLREDSEAYEDALDSLRVYACRHPEWTPVWKAIHRYVTSLEANTGLHEPGT